RAFLKTENHVSAQDLCALVKSENSQIGYTTVYRTLKLIVESGIGEIVDFEDGVRRFERKIGREYHAHFICSKCGKTEEIFDENIALLSEKLARTKDFVPQKHRFEVFGICQDCQ
ncbi:MAG: transcriptional repressor, partial [Candidatus Omnitrophica bacterium]|nr:transcriptional repressor [Candidatus Omnitrophota bacterium]